MHFRDPQQRAREYLRVAHRYRLGKLTTEQPHPETRELSRWARDDLPQAVTVLKRIDLTALETLERYAAAIDRLGARVKATLDQGRRIFLVGCGATGRLSLSLEFLWRQHHPDDERVRAFMAGGDVALVHALEGFEDDPSHGAHHLEEMGFECGDLLIACTEGGETPYVIGATQRAAEISSNRPAFLYCNADSALLAHVERFRRLHANPKVDRICLDVGPMALAGSTRMQASTVLQLAVGCALLHTDQPSRRWIAGFRRQVAHADFSFLADFVRLESDIYRTGDHVIYKVSDYGITVLTDTTERAPTFSLVPFDPPNGRPAPRSLCHVALGCADSPAEAWHRLLNREARPLNWPQVDARTTPEYLYGFDFSSNALETRRRLVPDRRHHEFSIEHSRRGIEFRLRDLSHVVTAPGPPDLFQHLLLKQMLNIHSTLVMGRLGRYEGNLMTWVTPTNGKLVDRAARYVMHLLANAGRTEKPYDEVVRRLFAETDRTPPGEAVVLRTYRTLLRAARAQPSGSTDPRDLRRR